MEGAAGSGRGVGGENLEGSRGNGGGGGVA